MVECSQRAHEPLHVLRVTVRLAHLRQVFGTETVPLRFLLTLVHAAQATPLLAVELLPYAGIAARNERKRGDASSGAGVALTPS